MLELIRSIFGLDISNTANSDVGLVAGILSEFFVGNNLLLKSLEIFLLH